MLSVLECAGYLGVILILVLVPTPVPTTPHPVQAIQHTDALLGFALLGYLVWLACKGPRRARTDGLQDLPWRELKRLAREAKVYRRGHGRADLVKALARYNPTKAPGDASCSRSAFCIGSRCLAP